MILDYLIVSEFFFALLCKLHGTIFGNYHIEPKVHL